MAHYELSTDHKMPPRSLAGAGKYPFPKMETGHSFHVPLDGSGADSSKKLQQRLSGSSAAAGKKLGKKFATRVEDDGVRVYCVAHDLPVEA